MNQTFGAPLPSFTLPSLDGDDVTLDACLRGRKGAVVVFWSSVCSHCVRYDSYLGSFAAAHPDLALIVLACRQTESREQIRDAARQRQLSFLLLHDADREVAHRWCVQQTPRVFLVDGERRLLYRGAIDNFKYPRDPEHEAYLERAIADFRAGRDIAREETPSFGCAVESIYYGSPVRVTRREPPS